MHICGLLVARIRDIDKSTIALYVFVLLMDK